MSSLYATEKLPSPMAVDGVVTVDYAARVLAVRLPDNAGGYEKRLWRESHGALTRAEESGWRTAHPFLWGGALGKRQIVHGLPGDGLTLTFHSPATVGDSVYAKLISRPGLYSVVTADRELCRFLSVQFRHRGVA